MAYEKNKDITNTRSAKENDDDYFIFFDEKEIIYVRPTSGKIC